MPDRDLTWWHADTEVLPVNEARPWVASGAAWDTVAIVEDELRLRRTGGTASAYSRAFGPLDKAGRTRGSDVLELQIRLRVASYTTSGYYSGSPVLLTLDDGVRVGNVAIGDEVLVLSGLTVVQTLKSGHNYSGSHVYRFRKDGSAAWELWIDDVLVGRWPYGLSAVTGGNGPVVGMSSFGVSDVYQSWRETAINLSLPREWRVERVQRVLPEIVQAAWNGRWRAWLRATVGLFEGALTALGDVWRSLTADRQVLEGFTASGALLPTQEEPAWSLTPSSGFASIVRDRIRFVEATGSGGLSYMAAEFDSTAAAGEETQGACDWTIQAVDVGSAAGDPADVAERAGPFIRVSDGTKVVAAELVPLVDAPGLGWQLTNGDFSAPALTAVGLDPWPIHASALDGADGFEAGPIRTHRVEVQLVRPYWAHLLVDGCIVDRVAYADLDDSADNDVRIGGYNDTSGGYPVWVLDVEGAVARRRWTDEGRRPLFQQRSVERLVHIGGCERNEELDNWIRHRHQVHQLRGTTRGILLEVWRLSCVNDGAIVVDTQPGEWVLEVSFPEVTPIYLEYGFRVDVVSIEFPAHARNFSPQELAELIAHYIAPFSTTELVYWVCLSTSTTGSAVTGGGEDTYPVANSDGFEVGDEVTIRTVDNATTLTTTITDIPDTTHIAVEDSPTVFSSGAIIRKRLARS